MKHNTNKNTIEKEKEEEVLENPAERKYYGEYKYDHEKKKWVQKRPVPQKEE